MVAANGFSLLGCICIISTSVPQKVPSTNVTVTLVTRGTITANRSTHHPSQPRQILEPKTHQFRSEPSHIAGMPPISRILFHQLTAADLQRSCTHLGAWVGTMPSYVAALLPFLPPPAQTWCCCSPQGAWVKRGVSTRPAR